MAQVLFEQKRKECASEHKVIRHGPLRSQARCTVCSKGGKVRAANRWLLTKCTIQLHEGVDGQSLHASHAMAHHRGVRICQICGFYSDKRAVSSFNHVWDMLKVCSERTSRGGARDFPPKPTRPGPWGQPKGGHRSLQLQLCKSKSSS